MRDRQHIIDKIQKLRNLANNSASTLDESIAAFAIAEKLLQDNAIEEAEIEYVSGIEEATIEDPSPASDWKKRVTNWQAIILNTLCDAYNCKGIIKFDRNGNRGFYIIGRPSDISIIKYQSSYFILELVRLANLLAPSNLGRGSGKTWYNSFYIGACAAIKETLTKTKNDVIATASSNALVVLNKHEAASEAEFNRLYPRTKSSTFNPNIDHYAYNEGKKAGAGLSTKPNLAQGVRGLLGS